MHKIVVGILAKLTRDGAKDIFLLVHSYNLGHPSPCCVIEDWKKRTLTGGHIVCLEEMFQDEVNKHPGYTVQERMTLEMETQNHSETQSA